MRLLLALLLLLATPALAQREVMRDGGGRITGTRSESSTGQVTIRDGRGRIVGTESRSPSGTVTIRDGGGRIVGTR